MTSYGSLDTFSTLLTYNHTGYTSQLSPDITLDTHDPNLGSNSDKSHDFGYFTTASSGSTNMTNDTLGYSPFPRGNPPPPPLGVEIRIVLYSVIFVLSIGGNALVILTLVQNRRMRTVTNVFLLNLSVSDLLLAVFCMPFTLIPTLMRNFIFGRVMCVMLRYIQAVSVSVSVFTLVSISLERYFAICEPLRSRSWQTISHSYKIIVFVWLLSFIIMVPIAVFQRLIPLGLGAHKCTEQWDNGTLEKAYAIFLDLVLLVFPLILMLLAYSLISWTLWKGIQLELRSVQELKQLNTTTEANDADEDAKLYGNGSNLTNGFRKSSAAAKTMKASRASTGTLRQNNTERSLDAKKRVIRMLFVVVLEFFVCWTPMYVLQTWNLFDPVTARQSITPVTMNMIHLLSYVSACCNPITYCFMNRKFRQGFLSAFRCCRRGRGKDPVTGLTRRPSDYTFASQRTGNNISQAVTTPQHTMYHEDQGGPSTQEYVIDRTTNKFTLTVPFIKRHKRKREQEPSIVRDHREPPITLTHLGDMPMIRLDCASSVRDTDEHA